MSQTKKQERRNAFKEWWRENEIFIISLGYMAIVVTVLATTSYLSDRNRKKVQQEQSFQEYKQSQNTIQNYRDTFECIVR